METALALPPLFLAPLNSLSVERFRTVHTKHPLRFELCSILFLPFLEEVGHDLRRRSGSKSIASTIKGAKNCVPLVIFRGGIAVLLCILFLQKIIELAPVLAHDKLSKKIGVPFEEVFKIHLCLNR